MRMESSGSPVITKNGFITSKSFYQDQTNKEMFQTLHSNFLSKPKRENEKFKLTYDMRSNSTKAPFKSFDNIRRNKVNQSVVISDLKHLKNDMA